MKNLSIVIPYRAGNKQHDINFKYVAKKLQLEYPKSELIVGEDTFDDPLFNRSRAVNNGVSQATKDIIMIHDADILLPKENVEKSMATLESYPMIFPYLHFWLLPKDLSRFIIEGIINDYDDLFNYSKLEKLGESGSIGAAVQIVTKEAFDAVGGYDERFVGWGWEDVHFNVRMKETYPLKNGAWGKWLPDSNVFHLWHPVQAKKETMGAKNQVLYEELVKEFMGEQ